MSEFIVEGAVGAGASEFSIPVALDGITAATLNKPAAIWVPPGSAQLQQLQVFCVPVITLGSVTVRIELLNLDNPAAAPTVIGTIVLDSTHSDGAIVLANTIGPRQAVGVLVTGSVAGLAGGGEIGGSFSGVLTGGMSGSTGNLFTGDGTAPSPYTNLGEFLLGKLRLPNHGLVAWDYAPNENPAIGNSDRDILIAPGAWAAFPGNVGNTILAIGGPFAGLGGESAAVVIKDDIGSVLEVAEFSHAYVRLSVSQAGKGLRLLTLAGGDFALEIGGNVYLDAQPTKALHIRSGAAGADRIVADDTGLGFFATAPAAQPGTIAAPTTGQVHEAYAEIGNNDVNSGVGWTTLLAPADVVGSSLVFNASIRPSSTSALNFIQFRIKVDGVVVYTATQKALCNADASLVPIPLAFVVTGLTNAAHTCLLEWKDTYDASTAHVNGASDANKQQWAFMTVTSPYDEAARTAVDASIAAQKALGLVAP